MNKYFGTKSIMFNFDATNLIWWGVGGGGGRGGGRSVCDLSSTIYNVINRNECF